MNFFQATGTLNVAQAKLEQVRVQVTETKSIHSSEDELDAKGRDTQTVPSLHRRQKTKALMNRKHNKEFRSVWYVQDEEEEDAAAQRMGLKKSVSLENMLDSGVSRFKARTFLTKNMISSPISARKIDSNWTRVVDKEHAQSELESLRRKMSDTVESASAAVEYFSKGKSVSTSDLSMPFTRIQKYNDQNTDDRTSKDSGRKDRLHDSDEELEAVNISLEEKYIAEHKEEGDFIQLTTKHDYTGSTVPIKVLSTFQPLSSPSLTTVSGGDTIPGGVVELSTFSSEIRRLSKEIVEEEQSVEEPKASAVQPSLLSVGFGSETEPKVDIIVNVEEDTKQSPTQPNLLFSGFASNMESEETVIEPHVSRKSSNLETVKDEQTHSDTQAETGETKGNVQSGIRDSPEMKTVMKPPVPVRFTKPILPHVPILVKSATLDRTQKKEIEKRPLSVQPSLFSSGSQDDRSENRESMIKPPVPARKPKAPVKKEEKIQHLTHPDALTVQNVVEPGATESQSTIQPSLITFGLTENLKTKDPLVVSKLDIQTESEAKSEIESSVGGESKVVEEEDLAKEPTVLTNSEHKKDKETPEHDSTHIDHSQSVILRQRSSSTSKNDDSSVSAIELLTFSQTYSSASASECKQVETPLSCRKNTHFRKHGTLEVKGRPKKVSKIEISAPTLPKMRLEDGNEVDMTDLDSEGVTNLLRMKSKSASDLLKSFNQIKNEKSEQLNTSPKFPISESDEGEEDVQVRRHQNITQYRCSKTTDFDFGRTRINTSKDFEVKGLTKFYISSDTSPIKLKKTDILKYQNGNFYKVDDSSKKQLKSNVILRIARPLNKKDVELKDTNNLSYILFFDSSKDAKLFLESDKIRCYTENDNKSTITKTLLRLLGKRSSREFLEKKGIYQNEPIFGNTLRNIYNTEKGVPQFILRTMELIEKPENITSLGIYRTSGNLATIQKIRFEVDKGRLGILNDYCKDVDVLTGCLKLFFRELKEPLIPCDVCDSLLSVTRTDKAHSKAYKGHIRQIINKLPEANSETLYFLIRHLIEVVKYKEENKMDPFNLSVCWGPTIIFMTDPTPLSLSKDPMMQTMNEARTFEALLTFYIDHPEELDHIRKAQEHLDSNKNPIQRQDSKESIRSFDSNASKKKSTSNPSLNVDEVLKKCVELIEANITSEGLYKKSGSNEKINKILKRMMKKKVGELERHRSDINELTDSLKKYLMELPEPLVTQECVEQVNKFCDSCPCLEANNRQRIVSVVERLPKKDNLVFLLRHIIKVTKYESQHNVSKLDMISIWTNVLNYKNRESNEKFSRFLRTLLDVFDETKADVMPSPRGLSNGLLNDLKNYQKDKDRVSKYDNVPDAEVNVSREATILEEKTDEAAEYTKL